jgi:hypothetical protein
MSDRRDTVLRKIQIERAEQEEKKRAKHTRGPWRAFQRPGEVGTNYWRLALKDEPSDSMAGYCGEANAHLLEAAPDLLDALDSAANLMADVALILGSTPATVAHVQLSKQLQRKVLNARAAIAKARGQS